MIIIVLSFWKLLEPQNLSNLESFKCYFLPNKLFVYTLSLKWNWQFQQSRYDSDMVHDDFLSFPYRRQHGFFSAVAERCPCWWAVFQLVASRGTRTNRRKRNGTFLELQLHSTFLQLEIYCWRSLFSWRRLHKASCARVRQPIGHGECVVFCETTVVSAHTTFKDVSPLEWQAKQVPLQHFSLWTRNGTVGLEVARWRWSWRPSTTDLGPVGPVTFAAYSYLFENNTKQHAILTLCSLCNSAGNSSCWCCRTQQNRILTKEHQDRLGSSTKLRKFLGQNRIRAANTCPQKRVTFAPQHMRHRHVAPTSSLQCPCPWSSLSRCFCLFLSLCLLSFPFYLSHPRCFSLPSSLLSLCAVARLSLVWLLSASVSLSFLLLAFFHVVYLSCGVLCFCVLRVVPSSPRLLPFFFPHACRLLHACPSFFCFPPFYPSDTPFFVRVTLSLCIIPVLTHGSDSLVVEVDAKSKVEVKVTMKVRAEVDVQAENVHVHEQCKRYKWRRRKSQKEEVEEHNGKEHSRKFACLRVMDCSNNEQTSRDSEKVFPWYPTEKVPTHDDHTTIQHHPYFAHGLCVSGPLGFFSHSQTYTSHRHYREGMGGSDHDHSILSIFQIRSTQCASKSSWDNFFFRDIFLFSLTGGLHPEFRGVKMGVSVGCGAPVTTKVIR